MRIFSILNVIRYNFKKPFHSEISVYFFLLKKKNVQTVTIPNQYFPGEKYAAREFLKSSTRMQPLKLMFNNPLYFTLKLDILAVSEKKPQPNRKLHILHLYIFFSLFMDLIFRLTEDVCQQVKISVPSVSVNTERTKSVLSVSPAS